MPETPVDFWNENSFDGLEDLHLMRLLAVVVATHSTDTSDQNFAEAIRKELGQRARLRAGKTRTWGRVLKKPKRVS